MARTITARLGETRAVLAVVLACAVLTYGGVSLFVVALAVFPVADALFRQAAVPHRLPHTEFASSPPWWALIFALVARPFMRHYLDYYWDIYWDLHLGVKGDAIPRQSARLARASMPHDRSSLELERLGG